MGSTPEQALGWLNSLTAGDVASAHLFAREDALAQVTSNVFASFFIFRDPRDVVVSHVFYVTNLEAQHVHHDDNDTEGVRVVTKRRVRLGVAFLERCQQYVA